MSYAIERVAIRSGSDDSERPRRSPAIAMTGIASLGILADRVYPITLESWLLLIAGLSVLWIVAFSKRWRWSAVVFLLLGWFSLAGAWHHWRWSCRSSDHIANSATHEPRLARVIGKVVQSPWIVQRPEDSRAYWQNPDRTILILACRSLIANASDSKSVSGTARVTVEGAISNLSIGDIVEVTGELSLPGEPANPGDFDQRTFLRAQEIFTIIRADFPECVHVIRSERNIWDCLLAIRSHLRSRAEQLIAECLGTDTAPVAQAMLLGSRVQIDDETRRAFRESGMLHVLAISGMNVGLLWSWLWSLSRWTGRSAETSTWIVLIALPMYAVITDANPPIVRATVVAVVVAFGQLLGRSGAVGNSLALAGLAVLAWNPSDLFNTGAQLSFLAVFAIIHATNWMRLLREQMSVDEEDGPLETSFIRTSGRRFFFGVIEANVVGVAVWLLTSPLIASEFHLVSPIGSLLTVMLVIPITLMFWVGYTFLLLGMIWSVPLWCVGHAFDVMLRGFLWTVRWGASLDFGHLYVPSPPMWWTIGFYGATLLPILCIYQAGWGRAISVRAGLAWMVLGLTWEVTREPHQGTTCTFISVGHGLSVMIECPNGRTALYDAGGMMGGGSIARSISQAVWTAGHSRLDAIIISHADSDHCNALPELSRIVASDGLFVHRSFLDWKQLPVAEAIEKSAESGTKVRLLSEGQSLVLDSSVSMNVLHPPHDFRSSRDNPNSIVLCIEYANRRILLTGDLELEGLERLLKTPPVDTDIMLSPHHGSLKANPPDLARWATPNYVIVSTPEPSTAERLERTYGPETQILTTAKYGAIRCHISPDGDLQIQPFKIR